MKYDNKFHQEATERTLKAIAEMKKSPINCKQELEKHTKMLELARKMEETEEKEKTTEK